MNSRDQNVFSAHGYLELKRHPAEAFSNENLGEVSNEAVRDGMSEPGFVEQLDVAQKLLEKRLACHPEVSARVEKDRGWAPFLVIEASDPLLPHAAIKLGRIGRII